MLDFGATIRYNIDMMNANIKDIEKLTDEVMATDIWDGFDALVARAITLVVLRTVDRYRLNVGKKENDTLYCHAGRKTEQAEKAMRRIFEKLFLNANSKEQIRRDFEDSLRA